jgi:hypothetical protein
VPRKKKATKKYSQMVYAANLAPFLQKAGSWVQLSAAECSWVQLSAAECSW